jgi:hypothetical protein
MAAAAPRTDKWTARENEQEKKVVLFIRGLVQVGHTGHRPRLTKSTSAGGAKVLVLDLDVDTSGASGEEVPAWMAATYNTEVEPDQYQSVEIRQDGNVVGKCTVVDDDEHGQHLAALTQAANRTHPPRKTAKKKAAKKTAKKRSAKKKAPARKSAKKASARKGAAKKRRPAAAQRSASRKKRPMAKRSAAGRKKRPAAKRRSAARKRR